MSNWQRHYFQQSLCQAIAEGRPGRRSRPYGFHSWGKWTLEESIFAQRNAVTEAAAVGYFGSQWLPSMVCSVRTIAIVSWQTFFFFFLKYGLDTYTVNKSGLNYLMEKVRVRETHSRRKWGNGISGGIGLGAAFRLRVTAGARAQPRISRTLNGWKQQLKAQNYPRFKIKAYLREVGERKSRLSYSKMYC